MSKLKDPTIKLFGKRIPLPANKILEDVVQKSVRGMSGKSTPEDEISMPDSPGKHRDTDRPSVHHLDEPRKNATQCKKQVVDTKSEEGKLDNDSVTQENLLKKPDKPIPCPRCNSMDTKFCYYNNYNVNQPRHFCKNCQRYWTAGGTMRNVPVGAGRRKNKHSTSQHRHMMMSSDGFPCSQITNSDSSHHQVQPSRTTMSLKENGTILKFGTESPLCESMENVLSLGEQKNSFDPSSMFIGENVEEQSSGSLITDSYQENELQANTSKMEKTNVPEVCNGVSPPGLQYYVGSPWALPWTPGWTNQVATAMGSSTSNAVGGQENCHMNPMQWPLPPFVMPHTFCGQTIPLSFLQTSYWGGMPGWTGGSWTVPYAGPNDRLSPSSCGSSSGGSGNDSPRLGKHCRDASLLMEEKHGEKLLWTPKTLRIDDPDEAVRSSIWDTLGIKNDQKESVFKGAVLKAFQPKIEVKELTSKVPSILQANPAALSRFQSFQESL